jgi:sugar O-acyltransferase (sialic acid O-acetyltransferase NeuD family)
VIRTPGPKNLIIVGDSMFAEIAHEYFQYDSPYEVIAFSVEEEYRKRDHFRGLPVIPFEQLPDTLSPEECSVFVAITYLKLNRVRERLVATAHAQGFALASYISSHAFVWRNVEPGEHCFVFENNVVQPFVRIGRNCVLWSGNHIGHHSSIGDNVFIASHAVISGSVQIGDNCFVGVNATVVNDVKIGADVWLGPNVVVTRDVEPNTVWRAARSERHGLGARELAGLEK